MTPPSAETKLVALAFMPPDPARAIQVIAKRAELAPVDVQMRLRAPPPMPLARLAASRAEALHAALAAEGLPVISCSLARAMQRLVVRTFELLPEGLALNADGGGTVQLPYDDLRLMLRGMRVADATRQREETHLKVQLAANPIGVSVRKVTERTQEKDEKIEHFVWLHGGSGLRVELADRTHFQGLGAKVQPSRLATIEAFVGELQQRAPRVVYDERLFRNARRTLPTMDGPQSQAAIAELLWEALLAGYDPGA